MTTLSPLFKFRTFLIRTFLVRTSLVAANVVVLLNIIAYTNVKR